MRILVNAVSAKSGGASTYVRNLAAVLARVDRQNEYTFYVPPAEAMAMVGKGNNVTVLGTRVGFTSSWRRYYWDQICVRQMAARERGTLLLSSSDFGVLFPPCRQILMIRNALFFSPIYLERILPRKSWRFKLEFFLRRRLIALSARSSDVVIAASRSMLSDVRRFVQIQDGKAVLNHFGVPLERFSGNRLAALEKAQAGLDKPLQILYVSEYSDYKNLTTLLQAIRILRERGADGFSLVTTADPSQFPHVDIASREEDRALAAHPSVAPFVRFTGPVPYEDIPMLYAASDIFIFPSLVESFGHPLVEAMASGLPIIASDIPICRELCSESAVYFSPLDPTELAEKILLLWNNADLRRRLGRLGRKRAEAHFAWEDHVERLVEIIDQVAAKDRG